MERAAIGCVYGSLVPPIFMPPVAAQQMIGEKMVERTLFVGM